MTRKLKRSSGAVGWLFILPWIIGFVVFFLQPIIQLGVMSFTEFELNEEGYSLLTQENVWEQYRRAMAEDAYFPTYLTASITNLLSVPLTVMFSFFSSVLLSQKFKGRTLMCVIFFLPLIISASVVSDVVRQSSTDVAMTATTSSANSLFNTDSLVVILLEVGMPEQIVKVLSMLITNVADLIWKSTIQTFIFLVALLSVPQSYYEVSQMEGATSWETFWKVTFPVCLPFVLLNTVYTILDTMSSTDNSVMRYIYDNAIQNLQYDFSAAMAWIYFLIIICILGLVFLAFKKPLKSLS